VSVNVRITTTTSDRGVVDTAACAVKRRTGQFSPRLQKMKANICPPHPSGCFTSSS
jgi:hypothetical protein